jgi:hypothetical protein
MNENPQNLEDLTILELTTIHTFLDNKLKKYIDCYDEVPSYLKKEYYGLCSMLLDVENSILTKVQKLRDGRR